MNEIIKYTKYPILLLYIMLNKYNDEDCSNLIRIFLKYHSNFFIKYNILKFKKLLKNKKQTKLILKKYYFLVRKQINILNKIKKIKNKFTNKFFWIKNIDKQIEYLENLNLRFLAIFECSKSNIFFHNKLILIKRENDIKFFNNIINEKLTSTYKLFGYNFFKNNKILLITQADFENLTFENKVQFTKYIFSKIYLILQHYLYLFKIYKLNQKELEILMDDSIIPFNIILENFDSEIEYNDIIY